MRQLFIKCSIANV